jgi:haloalkane dehalogenase
MHYIEGGNPGGDPILFVHGVPTWLTDWREVMPELAAHGRLIAVDLIGYGRSDKPHIEYTWSNYTDYFERFVDTLVLRNITFVDHDARQCESQRRNGRKAI